MLKPRRYRITPIGETWAEFLRAQGSRAGVPGELFSLTTLMTMAHRTLTTLMTMAHMTRCLITLATLLEMMEALQI